MNNTFKRLKLITAFITFSNFTFGAPPVLSPIADVTMDEGGFHKVQLSASDPENQPIMLGANNLPPFGALVDNGDGTGFLRFSPNYQRSGVYDITAIADDGNGGSDSQSFVLIVNNAVKPGESTSEPATTVTEEPQAAATEKRVKNAGVYGIWYTGKTNVLNQPYMTGGQADAQWGGVDKGNGVYNFKPLTNDLKPLKAKGLKATIQINGAQKPAWLYNKVPYIGAKGSGNLMYWHPTYKKAYADMLKALAKYINTSGYKNTIAGVRLNFNAVGTEHTMSPSNAKKAKWKYPLGKSKDTVIPNNFNNPYKLFVMQAYRQHISPVAFVFTRNLIDKGLETQFKTYFNNGEIGLFHTSSEVEPRKTSGESKYMLFKNYCKTGKTVAYAETFASAWGDRTKQRDHRWCSPPKWNYWTILNNLHAGVSLIAMYGSDLNVALTGKYSSKRGSHNDATKGTDYKNEFKQAFQFADKYAGYHDAPSISPGAWIALRENNVALIKEAGINQRKLKQWTGDYEFLMDRTTSNAEILNVINIGPDKERFGAWAGRLRPGLNMKFKLNKAFANSVKGKPVTVKVLYYMDKKNNAQITVKCPKKTFYHQALKNGKWNTLSFDINKAGFNGAPQDVTISVSGKPVYFHMVEILRK